MTHQTIDATIEPVQAPSKRYRCRHIFIDGHRCGSPSLRDEHLCYYHHTTRGFAEERRSRRTWKEFELPPLEDRSSVLAAVAEVLQRIACDTLPAKQAGLLLYGLQIAANNLPETDKVKTSAKSGAKATPKPDFQPVEQVCINPRYGDLAPLAEMEEDTSTIQISEQIIVEETSEKPGAPRPALEDAGEAPLDSRPAAPEPNILPDLNASADIAPSKPVILSEASRSLIARGAVEGPAVVLPPFLRPQKARHLDRRPEAAAERPLYFAVTPAPIHPIPPN